MSNSDQLPWLAEIIRLTAFTTTQPDLADLPGSWKTIVGDEPDAVESKPKDRTLQESGPFRESTLTFRYIPGRIDWSVHPSEMVPEAWGTIGKFADETPPFVELMEEWLAISPGGVKRLAFGAVLISPVSDREEGYRKVSGYLPFDVDLNDARNFQYQINRRRESRLAVPGLEINRLSKWSCMERRTALFTVGETTTVDDDSSPLFVARLEVDINTVPEYPNSLDPSSLADLLRECVDLGKEIAEKGDIP